MRESSIHPCIKSKSTQCFSPPVTIFFHVFFSIKNLIWPQEDPLNKGNMDFFIAFLIHLKLFLQEYIKKTCKNPPKKPITQLQVLIFFPQKQKSIISSPPACGNLPCIYGCVNTIYKTNHQPQNYLLG